MAGDELPQDERPNAPPGVVLDTNVVLDWLVFADPAVLPLAAAIGGGRLRWLATAAMRDELVEVLARGGFGRHRADTAQVLDAWDRHAAPVAAPPACAWRCADPDDQVFLDLAVHARAAALLTRDRALLVFGPRARAAGLAISPPARWRPPPG